MPNSTTDTVVVDTHVLLWWFGDRSMLSRDATEALHVADSIAMSPITFWEVAMLESKGRISLDRSAMRWVAQVEATHRFETIELSSQIAVRAAQLVDFHGDPADRIIAASSLERNAPLVTRDSQITDWAAQNGLAIIW